MHAPTLFKPPRYLRNAHVQTVLNSQGPRRIRAARILSTLSTQTITLRAEDGTQLLADFDAAPAPRSKLAILLHGWEGSSRSAYLVTTTDRLLASGFDVMRVNLRDHGDSHHLNKALFNSTRSPEVASALERYTAAQAHAHVLIAGFSLGASFALRIAADAGVAIGLDGVVAVCPPIDPARAMDALNAGFFAYERYFFSRWRQSLQRKLDCFPEYDYAAELGSARSLNDLNRIFIPQYTDYRDIDAYFAAYALVGDRLASLQVPAYLIAAEDDPIIPVEDVTRIDRIDALHIEVSRYGGHCGFVENLAARSWIETRMIEIFNDLVRASPNR